MFWLLTQLRRNGTEKEANTIASHLINPLILFQHMATLFAFFGKGFQNLDQLKTQFSHFESTLHQHSTHLGQLTKGYTELQQKTKELLERMPVLKCVFSKQPVVYKVLQPFSQDSLHGSHN